MLAVQMILRLALNYQNFWFQSLFCINMFKALALRLLSKAVLDCFGCLLWHFSWNHTYLQLLDLKCIDLMIFRTLPRLKKNMIGYQLMNSKTRVWWGKGGISEFTFKSSYLSWSALAHVITDVSGNCLGGVAFLSILSCFRFEYIFIHPAHRILIFALLGTFLLLAFFQKTRRCTLGQG